MYHVKDNTGKHVRCSTLAEAQLVEACWFKAGSQSVTITPLTSESNSKSAKIIQFPGDEKC